MSSIQQRSIRKKSRTIFCEGHVWVVITQCMLMALHHYISVPRRIIAFYVSGVCRLSWLVAKLAWWRHQMLTFPRYWSFVRRIDRSPVISPHKGQWRGALMFPLIWDWTSTPANNREAGDLRRHRAHYNVTVMDHCICLYLRCQVPMLRRIIFIYWFIWLWAKANPCFT